MSDLFGQYRSQSTLGLQRIDSSKYPDTNKDFESNVRRLNGFVDYISQYLQQMQKGVDQANVDPITRLRDFASDLGVLLGGGQLLYGIDLGDLQYYLPAIATMFGFNSGQPFPLNLFYAAENFLLGYIIPLDSWAFAIQDVINEWAVALGLDPDFVEAVNALLLEIQDLGVDLGELLHNLLSLFGIIDISDGFGPFGEIWHSITKLLGGFDIKGLVDLVDPVLNGLAPWIQELAKWLNILDEILDSLHIDPDVIADIQDFFGGILGGFVDVITKFVKLITGGATLTDVNNALKTFTSALDPTGTPLGLDLEDLGNAIWTYILQPLSLIFDTATWQAFMNGIVGGIGSLPTVISTLLGFGSTASTANTNAGTALSNFASILSGLGLGSIGSWVTDLLTTKSTASTANTNASTANTNATTAQTTATGAATAGQSLIDAVINAVRNTPGVTNQSVGAVEGVMSGITTSIYNYLGGNNNMRASKSQMDTVLLQFANLVGQQGQQIDELSTTIGGGAGFSAQITFRQPDVQTFDTPGSYSYILPAWFVVGTDTLDGVIAGGGGGGDGTGDVVFQGPGGDGARSKVTVNGVDHTGLYGLGGNNGSGPNPLWSGETMPDLMYLDILYHGATANGSPGAGGNAGNATPAGDRHGGQRAQWDTFTVVPTSATIPVIVGDGGSGGSAGFSGFAGKKGGAGKVVLRARTGVPASFTSMGTLIVPTWKLNTGKALTNAMMASAIWSRNPGSGGSHILIIRADSTFQNYVYLRIWYSGGNTNYVMGRVMSGSNLTCGSTKTITSLIPMSAFAIRSDLTRVFTISINGTDFDSWNDTVTMSSIMGPNNVWGGFGSTDAAAPGSIVQFAFLDVGTPSRITSNTIAASSTTASTTYADLAGGVGPAVTLVVPQSGEVVVKVSAYLSNVTAAGMTTRMGFVMSGSNTQAASDPLAAIVGPVRLTAGPFGTMFREFHLTGLTPGTTTFTAKYNTSTGTATFQDRTIIVDPKP